MISLPVPPAKALHGEKAKNKYKASIINQVLRPNEPPEHALKVRADTNVGKNLGNQIIGVQMTTPGDHPKEHNAQNGKKSGDNLISGKGRTKKSQEKCKHRH